MSYIFLYVLYAQQQAQAHNLQAHNNCCVVCNNTLLQYKY